ncbi:MAG: DUF4395 domain-containing protein [Sulfurovaceae bacterium]|nr:DUF4395 domain-containing protein [Sulfurovaceae bacterium]
MKNYIYFGETVEGYSVPVLNEREARAGAGILFAFGMISFLNAFLTHSFSFTQIFITVFMVDFIIRILINPKYSPSLILGRIFIQNQTPEYVGASQKRFAWSIGLVLSVVMFFLVVVFEVMTPIKIIICIVCLILLFSETAFGICLGCIIYHFVYKRSPNYCPGDVCEIRKKEEIQRISMLQIVILVIFLAIVTTVTYRSMTTTSTTPTEMKCGAGKCGQGKCGGGN